MRTTAKNVWKLSCASQECNWQFHTWKSLSTLVHKELKVATPPDEMQKEGGKREEERRRHRSGGSCSHLPSKFKKSQAIKTNQSPKNFSNAVAGLIWIPTLRKSTPYYGRHKETTVFLQRMSTKDGSFFKTAYRVLGRYHYFKFWHFVTLHIGLWESSPQNSLSAKLRVQEGKKFV